MKKFLVLMIAVLLLISSGSAVAEVLKCTNCGAEFNPELGYVYCPFCAMLLSKEPGGSASDFAAGDVITFGRYEQDNNLDNGAEPIEWIVLDVQDGKALLLSKYALDSKPYHSEYSNQIALEGIGWEDCFLRAWLNKDFSDLAFNAKELEKILVAEVDNGPTQGYSEWNSTGRNNTRDRFFLLSCAEATRYLGAEHMGVEGSENNVAARVSPTAYALSAGAWAADYSKTAEGGDSAMWWLRSSSQYGEAALVYHDGSLTSYYVNGSEFSVRPALWLNLESPGL